MRFPRHFFLESVLCSGQTIQTSNMAGVCRWRTALHEAVERRDIETLKCLLAAGTDQGRPSQTIIGHHLKCTPIHIWVQTSQQAQPVLVFFLHKFWHFCVLHTHMYLIVANYLPP